MSMMSDPMHGPICRRALRPLAVDAEPAEDLRSEFVEVTSPEGLSAWAREKYDGADFAYRCDRERAERGR